MSDTDVQQSPVPQLPKLSQPQPMDQSGMTTTGPNLQPRPRQAQWKASGIPGLAASIIQQVQARKKRELDSTMNNFVQNSRGLQEAQSQMEQARQANKQALAEFQNAKTPEAKQAAQEKLIQSAQAVQKAQQSLQVSQTNLKDMFNGPKADKHVKMLSKAFGVDDKNADSPERKAAIDAIRKQQQVDEKTARFMSMLPQRQQLTPQAQGQSMLQQAGVMGKPATQGQYLKAGTDFARMRQDRINKINAIMPQLESRGLTVDKGADGDYVRNPDGSLAIRRQTPEESNSNPVLRARLEIEQARTDLAKAIASSKTDPNNPELKIKAADAQSRMLSAQANMIRAQSISQLVSTENISSLAKMLASGGMAPSEVPARVRPAVEAKAKEINPQLNIASADVDFKYASNTGTQNTLKYLNSLTGADNKSGNLQELIKLSDSIKRTDLPPVNNIEAWSKLKSGDPQMASYYTAVTEVSDQVAKILQGGQGGATSDAKMRQAQEMFDKGFTKDQMRSVATTLRDLLANRKKELIGDNQFLKRQFSTQSGSSPVPDMSDDEILNQINSL